MRSMILLALPAAMAAQELALPELRPLPQEKDILTLWPPKTKKEPPRFVAALRNPRPAQVRMSSSCSIPLTEVDLPSADGTIVKVPASSNSRMPALPGPAAPCKP